MRMVWALAPVALALLLTGSVAGKGISDAPEQIMSCFNSEASWEPGTFEGFLKGDVARLHLHKVFWSSKPVPTKGDGPSLSIYTAATVSRLDTLASMCRAWQGILAVAVYVPVPYNGLGNKLDAEGQRVLLAATTTVRQLFVRMEAEVSSCVLRLLVLMEPMNDPLLARLLPINSLRNAALLAVDTTLTAMVDVDLMPCSKLNQMITTDSDGLDWIARTCKAKKVVVMPAFETTDAVTIADGQTLATDLAQRASKDDLKAAIDSGKVITFALKAYAPGHNATDTARWLRSSGSYIVQYQTNYEPWFILDRTMILLFDARFRGYGWNKVTQVAYHWAKGFPFVIHPNLFLIHRPHVKSDAQNLYRAATEKPRETADGVPPVKLIHRRVAALRHVLIRQMQRGMYENQRGSGVGPCLKTLPWWKDIPVA